MKPKRQTYDIATLGGGREQVTGYVLGEWGMRKERYNWEFTHLPTGTKANVGWYEKKDEALARLRQLAAGDVPEQVLMIFAKYGTAWGLGM